MQIADWFAEYFSLVKEQPTPFVSLAIICLVAGYLFAQAVTRGTISALRERVDLYKQKLDGASPEEASRRIKELEVKLRRLTSLDMDETQVDQVIRFLKGKADEINIDTSLTSSFGESLAEQLDEAFRLSGWEVHRAKSLYSGPRVREIVLRGASSGIGRHSVDRVKQALEIGEVSFRLELYSDDKDHKPVIEFRA
jgi:hypothetical protein